MTQTSGKTMNDAEMDFEMAASMGLSRAEWDLILDRLQRAPNLCELGIFSAMWSEHCSYKSSSLIVFEMEYL